ncbi:MAG TPA: glycoside hydrolase family 31 protein [Candidatus Sulfotelmatobacter sp.]|jgi:alpha-D-xyloside xylohydrolase|nr:glycoside hydrolase family 31 protein [Candidatus Sulfotelmatobacter sp.]
MFALKSHQDAVVFMDGEKQLRIAFVTESVARITLTEGKNFQDKPSLIVTVSSKFTGFKIEERLESYEVSTPVIKLVVSKHTGAISYFDAGGKLLVYEPERGGKALAPKKVFRNVFKSKGQSDASQNIDGARATAAEFETIFDRDAFEAKLEFVFADGEAIFGFGSHEEGYGSLRDKERLLYQQNMKIVVPYFVSTRGYGVLLDCGSLMTFRDDKAGACWWAEVVNELDFYFIAGGSFDEVTKNLHELTGKAPMLPKWAFGFAQSKERYVNARELVEVVREYRRRKIPLDLIVLDWKSWPNGAGWGQKTFDPMRFPDPQALTEELHSLGAHLMVSIWPIMTGDCSDQRELLNAGLMLGNQSTYNAFLAEARETYWQQARSGLFANGVDAWWCDCTEPFEADWCGENKPDPQTRLKINTEAAKKYLDPAQINSYSLLHSQGIYKGQRRTTSNKRVVNLTRSGYAGQHRYATICWNGDISATWETLRRCIPEGVNFCATGEPFWTVDIGGFFINQDPKLWFWRGDYAEGCRGLTDMNALEPDPQDTGCRDLGFWELYTRWLQYAVFLPMFRSHGTDAAREIWRFGDEGNIFYDTIAKFIRLRYQLIPYIYSLAAQVTFNGTPMLRAVALDFPADTRTHNLTDQFLFGPALLVCPMTTPVYYEKNSRPLVAVTKSREVYLPAGTKWFDFWTEEGFDGGRTVTADAPLNKFPLFVRAGSILPMTEPMQYVDEKPDAPYEIRIYRGADGNFMLYEDGGDGYDYEQGAFALVALTWNDTRGELTISARRGNFPGLVPRRRYHLVFVSSLGRKIKTIDYIGEKTVVTSG